MRSVCRALLALIFFFIVSCASAPVTDSDTPGDAEISLSTAEAVGNSDSTVESSDGTIADTDIATANESTSDTDQILEEADEDSLESLSPTEKANESTQLTDEETTEGVGPSSEEDLAADEPIQLARVESAALAEPSNEPGAPDDAPIESALQIASTDSDPPKELTKSLPDAIGTNPSKPIEPMAPTDKSKEDPVGLTSKEIKTEEKAYTPEQQIIDSSNKVDVTDIKIGSSADAEKLQDKIAEDPIIPDVAPEKEVSIEK